MITARSRRVQHIEKVNHIGHKSEKTHVCCNPRHDSTCCKFILSGGSAKTDFKTQLMEGVLLWVK